ncbi:unnamed protein product [Rhodiola kirilowii]
MAHISCELVWISRLLEDFQIIIPRPMSLFCDSNAAIYIAHNPIFHERTKHVELDCHLVRQHVQSSFLIPHFVPSGEQCADLFTKAVSSDTLAYLSSKLSVSNCLHTLSLRGAVEDPG